MSIFTEEAERRFKHCGGVWWKCNRCGQMVRAACECCAPEHRCAPAIVAECWTCYHKDHVGRGCEQAQMGQWANCTCPKRPLPIRKPAQARGCRAAGHDVREVKR